MLNLEKIKYFPLYVTYNKTHDFIDTHGEKRTLYDEAIGYIDKINETLYFNPLTKRTNSVIYQNSNLHAEIIGKCNNIVFSIATVEDFTRFKRPLSKNNILKDGYLTYVSEMKCLDVCPKNIRECNCFSRKNNF